MALDGWSLSTIGKISKVASGGTPSRKNGNYWEGDIPWVTTAEVQFGTIFDTSEKITKVGLENSSAKVFPVNTILMAMYGQGKTRGQVAKLGIEATTNQACAAIMLNNDYNVDYYFQFLNSRYKHIRDLSNSGGQENLSAGIIKSIQVPVPPLPEQKKIAQILSTWDKAITTTEKLLANSEQQKKALMQQLLTGRKRFPGFGGEWSKLHLRDCANCLDNKRVPLNSEQRRKMQGSIPYWGANGVVDFVNEYIFDETIVLLAEDGGYFDEYKTRPIANISYGKCWVNNHAHVLYAKDNCITEWLYYFLVHKNIMAFVNGGTRAKLNKNDMMQILIALPPLSEQKRITKTLLTVNLEIEILNRKINFLKHEKKSLMQQLLTGKRRVKIKGDAL